MSTYKSASLYSNRFRIIEVASYFILLIPWMADFLSRSSLPYGVFTLIIKITLSITVVVFIIFLRDVRKKIHSLDMLKQNLALSAIHDLKGPLTSIIGVLSVVSEPEIDMATKQKLLNVAAASSQSMLKLIQILVDTERMEIAKMILQKQKLDIHPMIKEYLKVFSPLSKQMGISLAFSIDKQLPLIYADKDILFRVCENLILNAFKYSYKGGEILVSVRYGDRNFYFEVKDTGMGIRPEYIDMVFDKYYRVEGQESESRKGSGIGLYFCRLAVEAHGGKIRIESKKGKGTGVFFNIPVGGNY